MKKFKNFLKNKIENWFEEPKEEPKPPTLKDILKVGKFNTWFKEIYDGYGGYPGSAAGIFGRTDKLSRGMVEDYFKYYNIDADSNTIYEFEDEIKDNWYEWRKKIWLMGE